MLLSWPGSGVFQHRRGHLFVNTYIVSFRYCAVKRYALEYLQMNEKSSDNRVYHLGQLRQHRNRRGLTQIELSKISGVSRATIARLEAGSTGAYRSTVEKLARALKVKPQELTEN